MEKHPAEASHDSPSHDSHPHNLPPLAWFHPAPLIATVGGIGHLPVAPGTWASLFALPCAWIIVQETGSMGLYIATLIVFCVGVWASDYLERKTGNKDPGHIVIDEVAGQWLAILAIEPNLILYGAGFVLFRLADIFKPWPVSWAERLPGGYGVMIDDILAGLYAGIGVYLLAMWL